MVLSQALSIGNGFKKQILSMEKKQVYLYIYTTAFMNKFNSLNTWMPTPNNDEKDINTNIKRFKV